MIKMETKEQTSTNKQNNIDDKMRNAAPIDYQSLEDGITHSFIHSLSLASLSLSLSNNGVS